MARLLGEIIDDAGVVHRQVYQEDDGGVIAKAGTHDDTIDFQFQAEDQEYYACLEDLCAYIFPPFTFRGVLSADPLGLAKQKAADLLADIRKPRLSVPVDLLNRIMDLLEVDAGDGCSCASKSSLLPCCIAAQASALRDELGGLLNRDLPPDQIPSGSQPCGCGAAVAPGDQYFASPCGTFCEDCMEAHAAECAVCLKLFGIAIQPTGDAR